MYTNKQKRELVKKDYNAIAYDYDNIVGNSLDNYYESIDKFINMLKGNSVLDVGCGSGQICNYIYKKGKKVKGLDFSINLLNIARANNPNIEFIYKDITRFKIREKFDGIFSKDTLYHLPDEDIEKTLKYLFSILNPLGIICIVLDMPKEVGEHFYEEELDNSQKIYYNYLSPNKLQDFLTNAGFRIIKKHFVKHNNSASCYAQGLMTFYAEKQ